MIPRLALVVALAGCAGTEYPPPSPLPAEYTDCTADECVVVGLGCCDHCNGGVAVAVNGASAATVRDLYSERCGRRVSCTLMGCPPVSATCDAGTCTLVQDTGF